MEKPPKSYHFAPCRNKSPLDKRSNDWRIMISKSLLFTLKLTHTLRGYKMKKYISIVAISCAFLSSSLSAQTPELQVFGQIEQTQIKGVSTQLPSRIDSGATISSAHAINIKTHQKDGQEIVTFDFPLPSGEMIKMKKKVVRIAKIRQASSNTITTRPVVNLSVIIQGEPISAEFTLKDRSHMTYPVLIGRNILKKRAIVDVSINQPL